MSTPVPKYKPGQRLYTTYVGHCTVVRIIADEIEVQLNNGSTRRLSSSGNYLICTPPPLPHKKPDPYAELNHALYEAWLADDTATAIDIVQDVLAPLLQEKELQLKGQYPFDVLAEARRKQFGDCNVYVILLKIGAAGDRRGKRSTGVSGLPSVYVGQTAINPQKRFKQHLEGTHSSYIVSNYGWALLPNLFGEYHSLTREMAENAEAALAKALHLIGCTVFGGH